MQLLRDPVNLLQMTDLLKKAFAFKQKKVWGFSFKARSFWRKKKRCAGLLPSLAKHVYAKGAPRFPRKKTGSKSSKWRGKTLERAIENPRGQCDPVLINFFKQLKARKLEVVCSQLICGIGGVATAADIICAHTREVKGETVVSIVPLEIKTGFAGTTNLDEQYSKRAKTICRGPFANGFAIQDNWRHRHLLQCALTAHFIEECYGTKTTHVDDAFVVYMDRGEWSSVKPQWWYNKEDLNKIVELIE